MTTATWDALVADVYSWTNRPKLVQETKLALRNAIRTAHRQGNFWRDLVKVTPTGLDTTQAVQSISLTDNCPNIRQICSVMIPEIPMTDTDIGSIPRELTEAEPRNLLDFDGYPKTNIYWALGDTLNIRAESPQSSYDISYYIQPVTDPETLAEDWLLKDYQDVVILFAASTVLSAIGEQEIKTRVDQLVAIAVANLVGDQTEATGR